jgi:hypothetical protein
MHIIGSFLWILATWKWGDWRNWKKYQSTILYMIVFSLLFDVLTYNHSLFLVTFFYPLTH